jgi:metal-sulfur cluster biosynthetic enzyme
MSTQSAHLAATTDFNRSHPTASDQNASVTSDAAFRVKIEMTLTSPTCVMGPHIFSNIHSTLGFLPGVASVDIALVWDPPWSKDRISEAGKMELGLI